MTLNSVRRRGLAWRSLALAFALLVAQGYIQLFFGYVENYTFVLLVLAAYTLAALRALAGRAPLLLPGALLVLALALHLSAAVLGASFAVLAVRRLTDPAAATSAVTSPCTARISGAPGRKHSTLPRVLPRASRAAAATDVPGE